MSLPEVWLRGPVPDVPELLQPVAHALMQACEEITTLMQGFPDQLLWTRPAGLASVGFHLQHLTGVLNRLFTYARGEALSEAQLQYLKNEGNGPVTPGTTEALVHRFLQQAEQAITQLKTADSSRLTEFRGVGRAQLPSTVLGLYVHGAEHTMRHLGQLLVTARMVQAS